MKEKEETTAHIIHIHHWIKLLYNSVQHSLV